MNFKTKNFSILLGLIFTLMSIDFFGQESQKLSLEDAVAIALENNHAIKVARNERVISENNAAIGNADFLPEVQLSAGYDYASNNTKLTFSDPQVPEIDRSGAVVQTWDASATLSYNIFSGGSKFYTYQQLQTQSVLGELQEKQRIEQTLLNLIGNFLEVVRLKDALSIDQQSIVISKERYLRAREKYAFGSFDKLALLNAEVDLRNDSTAFLQTQLSLEQSKKDLNTLLGISADSTYSIDTAFNYSENLGLNTMLDNALARNSDLMISRANLEVSKLDLKNSHADLWPSIDLNAGYQYNNQDNEAGFVSTSRTFGWNTGVRFTYDIFTGGRKNRTIQNNKVLVESNETLLDQTKNNLKRDITNAFDAYSTNLELLKLSLRNVEVAEVNYRRSREAFATGQITGIELRDAQLNLISAKNNVSIQRIQTKISEVNLLQLSGGLVR